MAQGEALDLLSRLGEVDRARAVYATLQPGSSVVAADGWLLEYVGYPPVLNGAIFAAFGLYDYWQLTGDPADRERFSTAAAAIARDIGAFRNPGSYSSYERSGLHRYPSYHRLQITELQILARLAGMPCLRQAADDIAHDA